MLVLLADHNIEGHERAVRRADIAQTVQPPHVVTLLFCLSCLT